MTTEQPGRRIVRSRDQAFEVYDLDGRRQDRMGLLRLSYRRDTGRGTYLLRMDPGAVTIPHTHAHHEEFLVLEGHLIEPDGTALGPGDYASFAAGTHHNSRTEDGCLLIVFEGGPEPEPPV